MTRNEKLPDNHSEGSGKRSARTTRSVQVPIELAKMARTIANHRDETIDKVFERNASPGIADEWAAVVAEMAAEQKEMAAEQKKQKKGG